MNYIKLLNAAFEEFFFDDRLNPTHVSLYMALFQEWNSSRFANEMYVNSRELMRVAKIGSKTTYHRCITDLHKWDYLSYYPSKNPFKGSKIKMSIIGTGDGPDMEQYNPELEQLAERCDPPSEPVVYRHSPTNGQEVYPYDPVSVQALVPTINNPKQININKRPKDRRAVLDFFNEKGFNANEGKKFFAHYENTNWETGDGKPIRDWRALSVSWMDRAELFAEENQPDKKGCPRPVDHRDRDNLKTTKSKDYGQPL